MREKFDPSDMKTLCYWIKSTFHSLECISRDDFSAWEIQACSPKMTSSHFNLLFIYIKKKMKLISHYNLQRKFSMRPKIRVLFSEHRHSRKLLCPLPTAAMFPPLTHPVPSEEVQGQSQRLVDGEVHDHCCWEQSFQGLICEACDYSSVISMVGLRVRWTGLHIMTQGSWWWQCPLPKEYCTKSNTNL